MVYADTVLRAVKDALDNAPSVPGGSLPSSTVIKTFQLDGEGENADVTLPIIELTPTEVRRGRNRNRDVVGYETNASGDRIGEIYRYYFEMPIQLDITTVGPSNNDHRDMARAVREILAEYDTRSGANDLPDPNSSGALSTVDVVVGDREPAHEFSTSPGLRVGRMSIGTRFTHELKQSAISGAKTPIAKVSQDIDVKDSSGTAHDAWDEPV